MGEGSDVSQTDGVTGKTRKARVREALKRKPATIKVAAGCLLLNVAISGLTFFDVNLKDRADAQWFTVLVIALVLMLRLIYGIHHGSQWARWFAIVWVGLCVLSAPSVLSTLTTTRDWIIYVAMSALLVVGALLLLFPKSGRWFKEVKEARRG